MTLSLSMFIFLLIMLIGLVFTLSLYIATVAGIYHGWRLGEKIAAKILNIERMPTKELLKKSFKEGFWL